MKLSVNMTKQMSTVAFDSSGTESTKITLWTQDDAGRNTSVVFVKDLAAVRLAKKIAFISGSTNYILVLAYGFAFDRDSDLGKKVHHAVVSVFDRYSGDNAKTLRVELENEIPNKYEFRIKEDESFPVYVLNMEQLFYLFKVASGTLKESIFDIRFSKGSHMHFMIEDMIRKASMHKGKLD